MLKHPGLICGLTPDQVDIIVRHYAPQPWEADYLSYTPEILVMHVACQAEGIRMDLRTFSHRLIQLRKHSGDTLPKKAGHRRPFPFGKGEAGLLIWLYDDQPTPRDRLSYTNDFEGRIANEFRSLTKTQWTDMQIFHGLMTLGKNGRLPKKGRSSPGSFLPGFAS